MHWPDSFQANRRIRGANLILQALLFTTLFGGINYLAQLHSWRFDLTRNRIFSLSAETVAYVENLEQPVHAVVAFDTTADDAEIDQARRDVVALLREYTHVLHHGRALVTFEEIDVIQSIRRAEQLGITDKNVVMFTSGDRTRPVRYEELYRTENLAKVAFQGEARFTEAILDVTTIEKQKVYFLTGHGEVEPSSPDAHGLSEFRAALRGRNFAIESLDLRQARKVPDDAALVLSIAPLQAFLPQEEELLRQYLNNQTGRLLLALNPRFSDSSPTGLEALLADWGLGVPDALVWDPDPAATMPGGVMLLRPASSHPVVKTLADSNSQVAVGVCRPIVRLPAGPKNAAVKLDFPVRTSAAGFGERTFRGRTEFLYNEGTDIKGPIAAVAVAEGDSAAGGNLPFSVRSGRLLVFGSSDPFTNAHFNKLGNSMLAVSTVNWALNRLSQVNVQPRKLEKFQLTLSEPQLQRLRLALLLIVPGGVALLGLIVYWSRRS